MKIPKVRQLPSGSWFCQVRVKGKSVCITEDTRDKCEARAIAVKAGLIESTQTTNKTLRQAIDDHLADRKNILSPATVRNYRNIQRCTYLTVMDRPISSVKNWQRIVDDLSRVYTPYTVIIMWGMIKTVLREHTDIPKVRLPQKTPPEPKFLRPEDIKRFVDAVKDTDIAIPALLALSGLRSGEIQALEWEDIGEDSIRVHASIVKDEHGDHVRKSTKTTGSTRTVPILIPELKEAIEKTRGQGRVAVYAENTLYRKINKVCDDLGVCRTGLHGLRHSFCSLCYFLRIPPKIVMRIGGWESERTMSTIYTHLAESDIVEQSRRISDFFR